MAQNRNIPFGYEMVQGAITVHPKEELIVLKIFQQYAEGLSYKSIAEELTLAEIPYLPDKTTWNKNMVARILQNVHYSGSPKYPPIITTEIFLAAQCAMKPYTKTVSPEIKVLKPLLCCGICGAELERKWIVSNKERWKCPHDVNHVSTQCSDQGILNQVWQFREGTRPLSPEDFENKRIDMELVHREQALKENSELSPEEKKAQLFELAVQRYSTCHCEEVMPTVNQEDWLGNILKIRLTDYTVTEIILKDGNLLRKE